MKVAKISTFIISALLSGCTAETAAPASNLKSGLSLVNFDRAVRPQDDFYRFVNGAWLAKTEIPGDKSDYGVFTALDDLSEQRLNEMLMVATVAKDRDADTQKVGDFYESFMDEAKIESLGLKPLAGELARIDAIRTPRDLAAAIGRMQRIGVAQPFAFFINIDRKNSSQYMSYVAQRGISMPDRDYYLSDDAKMQAVREKYRAYVGDLLTAAGTPDAAVVTDHIIALEKRLAQNQWTRVRSRDAEKTYNKYTIVAAQPLLPNFDWRAFFEGVGAAKIDELVASQPSFFNALGLALQEVPLAHWREYLRYHVIAAHTQYLPARFVNLQFDFYGRVVSGTTELEPRWKRGVHAVDASIGELTGKLYVAKYFPPEAKQRVLQMVDNIRRAYSEGIDRLDWMSAETKREAHAKLAKFTPKIGYPDKWKDWSKLEVRRDDLIGNVIRASIVDSDRNIAKLGQPVDHTEWRMTPQTVNAYYFPPANEIVFPAAILQPPFFDPNADDAVNYGAIGSVIGHEMSHGYDDQGRHYDGDGNLRNWWTDSDDQEFRGRAAQLGREYNGFSPLPNLFVNGALTMGENIADLAGVAMSYRAYKLSLQGKEAPTLDGFTGDQRFFIGYGQIWAR
ncbi:MAG TPA: M13 family metallopeptidase, partial [Steroidobacteraceae bacterium]|nr:M13 family metallopeptidase [Steroidobacteraceae bacterium]